MKMLTIITAITFTLSFPPTNAQAKLINDSIVNAGGTNNNELKFEKGTNGAFVSWQASNECSANHFELQISYDNKTFETIKTLAVSSSTECSTNYNIKFRKTYISVEKVYYRVKTIFTNGTSEFTASSAFKVEMDNGVSYASLH